MSIAGIVLAAGASRRMGTAKSLLELEGSTFLERGIRAMRGGGCDPVVVVVGEGPEHERAARLAGALGSTVIVNRWAGSEQLHSLRLALDALPPDTAAAVVCPVDVPRVAAAHVAALIAAARASGAPLALTTHAGRHHHPVLFSRSLFRELRDGDPPEGARSIVHAHLHDAVEVESPEPLGDVDTPRDLRRLHGG